MVRFSISWAKSGVFVIRFVDGVFAGRQFGVSIKDAIRQFGIKPEQAVF